MTQKWQRLCRGNKLQKSHGLKTRLLWLQAVGKIDGRGDQQLPEDFLQNLGILESKG